MKMYDFLPIYVYLTDKYPDLIFWKHFERGINGQGDIDAISTYNTMELACDDFVKSVFELHNEVEAVIGCRASNNVCSQFIIAKKDFPNLFQFDISYAPVRLGVPWCYPQQLIKYSKINEYGVRVLTPGALSIVLFLLYGISPSGRSKIKKHDYENIILGVNKDEDNALNFILNCTPKFLHSSLIIAIKKIKQDKWSRLLSTKIWFFFMLHSIKKHLSSKPKYIIESLRNKINGLSKIHHHTRKSELPSIELYIKSMYNPNHNISVRSVFKKSKKSSVI